MAARDTLSAYIEYCRPCAILAGVCFLLLPGIATSLLGYWTFLIDSALVAPLVAFAYVLNELWVKFVDPLDVPLAWRADVLEEKRMMNSTAGRVRVHCEVAVVVLLIVFQVGMDRYFGTLHLDRPLPTRHFTYFAGCIAWILLRLPCALPLETLVYRVPHWHAPPVIDLTGKRAAQAC